MYMNIWLSLRNLDYSRNNYRYMGGRHIFFTPPPHPSFLAFSSKMPTKLLVTPTMHTFLLKEELHTDIIGIALNKYSFIHALFMIGQKVTMLNTYSDLATCLRLSTLWGLSRVHVWNNSSDSWIRPSCLNIRAVKIQITLKHVYKLFKVIYLSFHARNCECHAFNLMSKMI